MWCDVFIIKLNLEIKQWSVHENPSHQNMNEQVDERCRVVEKLACEEGEKNFFLGNGGTVRITVFIRAHYWIREMRIEFYRGDDWIVLDWGLG